MFNSLKDLRSRNVNFGVYGDFIADTYGAAVDTASSLEPVFGAGLPADGLARELAVAARVINLNVGARVINVTLGGFDTHDAQEPSHGQLLAELDAGIDAFFNTNLADLFGSYDDARGIRVRSTRWWQ